MAKVKVEITDEEKARLKRMEARPPLSEILNLHDFEVSLAPFDQPILWLIHCEIGYRSPGDAGESMGLLFFRWR